MTNLATRFEWLFFDSNNGKIKKIFGINLFNKKTQINGNIEQICIKKDVGNVVVWQNGANNNVTVNAGSNSSSGNFQAS